MRVFFVVTLDSPLLENDGVPYVFCKKLTLNEALFVVSELKFGLVYVPNLKFDALADL